MLNPVIPFEPVLADRIIEGPEWVAQVKWDGVRILIYYDGKDVRLYNRKKNERTWHYPELTNISSYCNAKSVILDGEVIALGSDGKPSFHEVMRRDAIRRMERVRSMQRRVPITYMIFDVIYFNGKWLDKRPLKERCDMLSQIIMPHESVQLVDSYPKGRALFQAVKQQQLEGIILKNVKSTYVINGKDRRWQKVKNYKDLHAVIGGVTLRSGIVNAVLLGLYDSRGRLWYIGHAGTGKLTQEEWKELTEKVKAMEITDRPFHNPHPRMREAVWLKPELTVKVQFIEWTASGTLRQPSIQSFVNVRPQDCVLDE